MFLIYSLLFYCAVPFILLRLLWKGRWARVSERFACNDVHLLKINEVQPLAIWLHAVSLGEVIAATPLIERCLASGWQVLVTTMTPTGSAQVIRQFQNRVFHQYLPYDLPDAVRRFLKKWQPCVGIIMETELWPNLMLQCAHQKIPLLLANARISDKAMAQYRWIDWITAPILRCFSHIYAQSALDAERYQRLGATKTQVVCAGNLKFDFATPQLKSELLEKMQPWTQNRTVLIAASTHAGEEQILLNILPRLQQQIPHLLLLIAPRHPERFDTVFQLVQSQQFQVEKRSNVEHFTAKNIEVLVLDSIGELLTFYALSDYAFVGGSLVPIGGHNVLEPIALNKPVICGPYMHNSKMMIESLCEKEAIMQVNDAEEFVKQMIQLHTNEAVRAHQIQQAAIFLEANKGAIDTHFAWITAQLAVRLNELGR